MTNTEPGTSSNLDGVHSTPTAGEDPAAGLYTEIPPGHDWQITDWRQPPLLELEDGELSMDSLVLNLQDVNHNDLCWGQNNEDPEPWSAYYSDKESRPASYPTTFSEISSATSVSSCDSLDSRTPMIKFMTPQNREISVTRITGPSPSFQTQVSEKSRKHDCYGNKGEIILAPCVEEHDKRLR